MESEGRIRDDGRGGEAGLLNEAELMSPSERGQSTITDHECPRTRVVDDSRGDHRSNRLALSRNDAGRCEGSALEGGWCRAWAEGGRIDDGCTGTSGEYYPLQRLEQSTYQTMGSMTSRHEQCERPKRGGCVRVQKAWSCPGNIEDVDKWPDTRRRHEFMPGKV